MSDADLRWRKFSPLDRDFPIYELMDGEVIVLDVTRGENQSLEIAFHEGAAGRAFDLKLIERLIEEVKVRLAQEDPT
ncbi:MAG TPA: hypothetical protein VIG99_24290 [Myxococcaceae bacterium]